MAPPSYRMFENRKFMWDGAVYPQEADAEKAARGYRDAKFDAKVVAEGAGWLVFTRRKASADSGKS